jgi:hypothetical protein
LSSKLNVARNTKKKKKKFRSFFRVPQHIQISSLNKLKLGWGSRERVPLARNEKAPWSQ